MSMTLRQLNIQKFERMFDFVDRMETAMNEEQYKEDLAQLIRKAPSGKDISSTCDSIKHMLLVKNIAYGNSALNPIRVFAKSDTVEQLYVRIDDKLNRLKNGKEFIGDNDIDDLLGYLILLKIALKSPNTEQNDVTNITSHSYPTRRY